MGPWPLISDDAAGKSKGPPAFAMAELISAELFLDRWQNYRDQFQQVAAVRALHAAIAALAELRHRGGSLAPAAWRVPRPNWTRVWPGLWDPALRHS